MEILVLKWMQKFKPWPNVKFLRNIVEFSTMVAAVLLWHRWKCLYYSITLNKPLMSVRKNISQIVSRLLLTFDLLHSIDHQRQSKSTFEFPRGSRSPRNHKPLKILTDLLICGHETPMEGWGLSWNWSELSWNRVLVCSWLCRVIFESSIMRMFKNSPMLCESSFTLVVGGAVVVRGGEKAAFLAHTATLAASLGSKKDQLRSEVPTRGLLWDQIGLLWSTRSSFLCRIDRGWLLYMHILMD